MKLSYAILSLLALSACSDPVDETAKTGEMPVFTTFYPTTYFAERIAGGLVEVVCPVPEGADPIFWQPERDVLARYQRASLVIVNGAGFEKWIEQASLPTSRMVDTARSFERDFITFESATTHSHGAGGEHTHEGLDGHTWLDPELAREQARAILDALKGRWPDHAEAFDAGYRALTLDLEALGTRLAAVEFAGATVLCSHPAYNYIAQRYAWPITNFDLDPDGALGEEQLDEIRGAVPEGAQGLMLWESAPRAETVTALAALGVQCVEFSPCELLGAAERAAGKDYLSVMGENLDRLEGALSRH